MPANTAEMSISKVGGDLPAHDGKQADRAPSDDLPDRDDNKYADQFHVGLSGFKDRVLSSPAAMRIRRQTLFLAMTNSIGAHLLSKPITSPALDSQAKLQLPALA